MSTTPEWEIETRRAQAERNQAQARADATARLERHGLPAPTDDAQVARVLACDRLDACGAPRRAITRVCLTGATEETAAILALRSAPGSVVVLGGAVGVGKSTAALAWLLEHMLAGTSCRWVHAHDLDRLSGREDRDNLDRVLAIGALVIDDLGVEYLDRGGYLAAVIDRIVSARTEIEAPTVITTNVTPDTFVTRYGQRVADRIREAGGFIQVAGASRRVGAA